MSQTSDVWSSVASSGDGFSIDIPPETIVIGEDPRDYTRLILSSYEVRFEISRQPNRGRGDSAIRIQPSRPADGQDSTFELGKVVGRVNISERPGRSATRITASSSKYIYTIAAYGRRPDHPSLLRFLASIKFGSKPLLNTPAQPSDLTGAAIEFEDLENSPIVEEYLAKPLNKKIEVSYESLDPNVPFWAAPAEAAHNWADETRSLIILRMPKPAYSPAGQRVSGKVSVQVTLLATGQVGNIVADPELDRGLAKSAANAAKQIKFIPTEVRGQLVDVKRTFVYVFQSY